MILIYYKTWIYQCLKESQYMVSRPELGSDPPFGLGWESGSDKCGHYLPTTCFMVTDNVVNSLMNNDIDHMNSITPLPDRVYGMCNRRVAYVHQELL